MSSEGVLLIPIAARTGWENVDVGTSCSQIQLVWQVLPGRDHIATLLTMVVWRVTDLWMKISSPPPRP